MKKTASLIALAAAIAACSPADREPAAEPTEAATPEPATAETSASLAADGQPAHGNYKITRKDGTVIMSEVRPDGTYTDTIDGEVVETGRWEQPSPDVYCYTSDEEGAAQVCNDEAVDANGVWTSTNRETGEAATVERVAE